MSLTLLLDLDDTLLGNEMGIFIPAYLQALGDFLSPYAPGEKLIPALLAATQQMIHNDRPDCTLKEVFDSAFYPAINAQFGAMIDEVRDALEAFYREVFPSLRRLTQFRPQAREMVKEALARGYRLAIATSPLFPLTAIQQRLEWAGVSPDDYDFRLICSFETFHFAKPNPAFYAEVLAHLGWPEEPALMVGNDSANDIEAARRAGLPAYQITANQADALNGPHGPIGSGWLDGFFPWLDSLSPTALEPDFTAPEAILKILRSTPAALDSLTRPISWKQPGQQASLPSASFPPPLSPAAWATRPAEGAWSITEIVCHLRDVDGDVNLPRIRNIIQVKNPFLVGMNTDLWAEERHYNWQDGREALYQFTQYRLELLAILEKFSADDWKRPARHAIFGPSQLQELVGIIAGHDRLHVRQVSENLAALNAPTVNSPI